MTEDQRSLFEDLEAPSPDMFPAAFLAPDKASPTLKQVRIDGLKAFNQTTVVLPLLTVLTGPNNSGKLMTQFLPIAHRVVCPDG